MAARDEDRDEVCSPAETVRIDCLVGGAAGAGEEIELAGACRRITTADSAGCLVSTCCLAALRRVDWNPLWPKWSNCSLLCCRLSCRTPVERLDGPDGGRCGCTGNARLARVVGARVIAFEAVVVETVVVVVGATCVVVMNSGCWFRLLVGTLSALIVGHLVVGNNEVLV